MLIRLILIASIILQFLAAFEAVRLTRATKFNFAWILITIGFLLVGLNRLVEMVPFLDEKIPFDTSLLNTWIGLVVSIVFAVGVLFIRRIFIFIQKVEKSRRDAEKRILTAIIQTEENERKRFAKDLHDGLGPILSTIKMSVSSLASSEKDAVRKEIVDNTEVLVNEAIRSIKDISNNLSPHILNNFGLASAIRTFTNKISISKAIEISFESNMYEKRLEQNIEIILYRIVCELINNTLKHARAQKVDINLTSYMKVVNLIYTDDGIGFDVERVLQDCGGMGYNNIFSRLRSIKGNIHIESTQETGTKVLISVTL